MNPLRLGARERIKKPDERKLELGGVSAPTTHTPVDISWLEINQQGDTPFCGEHAATHLQAMLEHGANGVINRFSPRYGAIKMKTPGSSVYDGFPVDDGTDIPAIVAWLKTIGTAPFDPLGNNLLLAVDSKPGDYLDPNAITPEMDSAAAQHKDIDFGYNDTVTYETISQSIAKYTACLLLIKCDDGLWGTKEPTFTQPLYGHFVTAYDWDETGIWIVDSAEPNTAYSLKHIATEYITPTFFFELGTAVDALPIETQIVSDASEVVQDVAHDTQDSPTEKKTLLGELEEIVEEIETII